MIGMARMHRFVSPACLLALALSVSPALAQSSSDATPPASASAAPAVATPPAPVAPTPSAAPAPSHPGTRRVRLTESNSNVVRSGPGNDYSIVGVFKKGVTFVVIAKSGDWYNVQISDSETGWIHSSLCKEFDDMSDLEFRPNPKLFTRTGSFILSGYAGAYAFDRKSNSLVLGGRLGYYVFDRLQAEGGVSWTHVRRPAEIVETLFGLTLEAEDFHMLFYHLLLNYELLPGRQMVPYLSAGLGSSIMQGETEPSFNFGGGTTLYLSKRQAVRWEVRDYRMDTGAKNARVTNHNVEFTLGTSLLF
jgi:outer membrane beta-barrel protein